MLSDLPYLRFVYFLNLISCYSLLYSSHMVFSQFLKCLKLLLVVSPVFMCFFRLDSSSPLFLISEVSV